MLNYIKLILLVALTGCCTGQYDVPSEVTSHGSIYVDQLFRDHYGYRVLYTRSDGIVIETTFEQDSPVLHNCVRFPHVIPEEMIEKFKFYTPGVTTCRNIIIIRDLEPTERGYANYIRYRHSEEDFCVIRNTSNYVEIHLPKSVLISPGVGSTGGKYPIKFNIHEIK